MMGGDKYSARRLYLDFNILYQKHEFWGSEGDRAGCGSSGWKIQFPHAKSDQATKGRRKWSLLRNRIINTCAGSESRSLAWPAVRLGLRFVIVHHLAQLQKAPSGKRRLLLSVFRMAFTFRKSIWNRSV